MFKNLIIFLLIAFPALAKPILSNGLELGDGTASNKTFTFNRAGLGSTNPAIRWNEGLSRVEFSNDGSAYSPIASGAATDQSYELTNLSIASSVSANAMTIALKNKAGNDPSSGDAVLVSFRNATSTNGSYVLRTQTSALSLTIPSGTTIGTTSGKTEYLYVYLMDNSGTLALAVSMSRFDEGSIQSSSAISGGATSTVLYSSSSLSNKSVRLIGRIQNQQSTAGTWASSAIELAVPPFRKLTDWFAHAVINGANAILSTGNVSSWTDIPQSGLAMTQLYGSETVQIPCSSTNPSTGLTCGAGTPEVGIVFNVPISNTLLLACVNFAHEIGPSTSNASVGTTYFSIVETPNNSQTISQQGNNVVNDKFYPGVTTTNLPSVDTPFRLCEPFFFTTSGSKTLRLEYQQTQAGSPTSTIQSNQTPSQITWEVYPINQGG